MGLWLDGYDKHTFDRWPGGAYVDQGAGRWKLLIHTLEGSVESGMTQFGSNGVGAPHCTVSLDRGIYKQHIPLDRHAYALRNRRGGTETNRDHVIQVEVEGFARDTHSWTPMKLAQLAFNVIEPILDVVPGIELAFANFDYNGAADGYGLNGKVRMSAGEWDAFSGILGHVHAPENTHWDPGALNTAALMALLTSTTSEEDNEMGIFQKINDPDTRREWVAVESGGKPYVREFSKFRGQGDRIDGLGYVIDDFVDADVVGVIR